METENKYSYQYPHPAVTVDCVIFGFDGSDLNVLLIERGIDPYKGSWALPGGFVRMDETAEEAASRELREETNVRDVYMEQLKAFSGVDRDPRERVISIAFYALLKQSNHNIIGGDDAKRAQWYSLNQLPADLAFDHKMIIEEAVDRLKQKLHFEPIGFELLNDKFTMPQLQSIYEAIWGFKIDRRNFYKKMMSLGYLNPLNEKMEDTRHRAAIYYSFNPERYLELKENRFILEFKPMAESGEQETR